ncbi:hypothetical protein HanRHA438_Chr11g0483581 [Helianthus annuus]|nr:hypothetical protein HanRHA438_Chr11g0483581 [Helianthus annuus]
MTRNFLRCDPRPPVSTRGPYYTYTLLLGLHTITSPTDWAEHLDYACYVTVYADTYTMMNTCTTCYNTCAILEYESDWYDNCGRTRLIAL